MHTDTIRNARRQAQTHTHLTDTHTYTLSHTAIQAFAKQSLHDKHIFLSTKCSSYIHMITYLLPLQLALSSPSSSPPRIGSRVLWRRIRRCTSSPLPVHGTLQERSRGEDVLVTDVKLLVFFQHDLAGESIHHKKKWDETWRQKTRHETHAGTRIKDANLCKTIWGEVVHEVKLPEERFLFLGSPYSQ